MDYNRLGATATGRNTATHVDDQDDASDFSLYGYSIFYFKASDYSPHRLNRFYLKASDFSPYGFNTFYLEASDYSPYEKDCPKRLLIGDRQEDTKKDDPSVVEKKLLLKKWEKETCRKIHYGMMKKSEAVRNRQTLYSDCKTIEDIVL
ncbi:hypothetical protein ILUMI_24437 [Ignelater luminosus]|uniref:Uncharacterized protein n=1 Tax=Ignelater luminosus TaxID=2038154 RepID=A0A8K0CDG3_IGNLU|nr:hypothetical protein ILUMI_24437 [Ignelater luminosus]